MPSVESFLTRELDLRFIDARNLATEARLSLGIQGYPDRDQVSELRREAIRIYQSKTYVERRSLQQLNMDLESIKIPAGSSASSTFSVDEESMESSVTSESRRRGIRTMFRR